MQFFTYLQASSTSNFQTISNSIPNQTLSAIIEDTASEVICTSIGLNSPANKYLVTLAKTNDNVSAHSPVSASNNQDPRLGSNSNQLLGHGKIPLQSVMRFSSPDTLSSLECFLNMEDDKEFIPTITIPTSLEPRNDHNSTSDKLYLKKEDGHSSGGIFLIFSISFFPKCSRAGT